MAGGPALEVIHASRTAPAATIGPAAAVAGDSLQVKNFKAERRAYLLQVWSDHQAAGTLQIRSSALHDNNRGLRFDTIASDLTPYLPFGAKQPLSVQDTLTVEFSGSAVAGDVEQAALMIFYEELEKQVGNFIDETALLKRMTNLVTVENTITTTAGPGYSGAETLEAESALLIAKFDYALLGYIVDTECCSVLWRGPDTGNMRVGGPGIETDRELTRGWFRELSKQYGMPLIPVIHAADAGATFVEAVQDENAAAVTVISILAQLA